MNPVYNVEIYEGITTKYYVIDGIKFHINFPIQWALDPLTLEDEDDTYLYKTGPLDCLNCRINMTVRGIFIGYCSNCLYVCENAGINRGNNVYQGVLACLFDNDQMHERYPYMASCDINKISDRLPEITEAELKWFKKREAKRLRRKLYLKKRNNKKREAKKLALKRLEDE